ncbi:SET2 [[Candida] subhashii]|uniref:Histone-lysine N-methyltransferase, H3 lysine-36 specific n=1 Tax=[Candida] subhashii TaxID=561895 RepID=A0A8J5QIB4_9ASCO|nr:SET2 [[Candida] subhashii]KAG7661661.1 SET2 [[Candida] subhashii]
MNSISREITETPPVSKQHTPAIFTSFEDKTEEAVSKFTEIPICTYLSKQLGSSQLQENMTCDCQEEWDPDLQMNLACNEESHCINRVTSVECMNRHCLCGNDCQNQRFQRREYAKVSVFQTELKGYGLRADSSINENQFIYEYVGEVIDEVTFRTRMVEYDQLKFKHFYFMMLKSDSFIDATVKGSLARFINHSCNPNAYVDKWVVGDKLRMGIFAKRKILKGEEITFDYNVDRYGAQSQPCYCGEPNCIKFMGGKTQTDAALLLPEGIADALGVSAKDERQWLKENKHLRTNQQSDDSNINEEFIKGLELRPLQSEVDVSRVMSALMKSQDLLISKKLIQRLHMTEDPNINLLIIKFHGYKTLSNMLKEYSNKDGDSIVEMILEILSKWPKVTRNKISSSQIEDVIKQIQSTTKNKTIKSLATDLLKEWSKLQMAYRIPKGGASLTTSYTSRISRSPDREDRHDQEQEDLQADQQQQSSSPQQQQQYVQDSQQPIKLEEDLPEGWEVAFDPRTRSKYYYHRMLQISRWDRPAASVPRGPKPPTGPRPPIGPAATINSGGNNLGGNTMGGDFRRSGSVTLSESELAKREELRIAREKRQQYRALQEKERQLQELIAQNREIERRKQEEMVAAAAAAAAAAGASSSSSSSRKGKKSSSTNGKNKHHSHHEEISVEAKWKYVLAKHIPNLIKKYEKEIGRDNIKGCARDLVNILANKEAKKDPEQSPPKELDNHKLKKIKDYSKTFMEKFLIKYRSKKDKKRSYEEVTNDSEAVGDEAVKRAKV